ncbi:MAG: YkgJ family cysteine cluster protein [Candidatus Omnitrophota bacterium]|jgi:Fe-S-cluster containining protein|nr:MAG: YkgJ family cysteine cluster protein [Candidatus Omnitrophota bacterium]
MQIKQFIPRDVCLSCKGCCRFLRADSVWSPCLLDEEIQDLLGKNIPAANISINKKLLLVQAPDGQGYLCPFLKIKDNKCSIYNFRPFECQLYPFLLNLRHGKIILTVDLNCPYVKEKLKSKEFKEYVDYLNEFLNSPAQLEIIKDNPHILQTYEEVLEIIELSPPDGAK